jgi:tRNA pseudouridine38-40 synthase
MADDGGSVDDLVGGDGVVDVDRFGGPGSADESGDYKRDETPRTTTDDASGGEDRMRAFRIAYDGRSFYGFQRQPTVPTVEGTLLDAIRALGLAAEDGLPPGYAAAGRTDAGVSALGQTVGFRCPAWCSPAALNSELPAEVRAWARADTGAGFHATHDATSRTYTYYLHAPDADDGRVAAAAAALCGEHDFANLTPDDEGTVRDLRATVGREGSFLVVQFVAGGFARQLVRRAVSLLHGVGEGAPLATVERTLIPAPLAGPDGIPPAPAEPLVLTAVDYPELSFSVDDEAAARSKALFDDRVVDGLVRARVAGHIRDGLDGGPVEDTRDEDCGPATRHNSTQER